MDGAGAVTLVFRNKGLGLRDKGLNKTDIPVFLSPKPLSLSPQKFLRGISGFTLAEVLVAMMLAVTVFAGMFMAYTQVVRYAAGIRQKTSGTLSALAALKLITQELQSTSCVHDNECSVFNGTDGIVYCNPASPNFIWGRKHDPAQNDLIFRFEFDSANQRILYCPHGPSLPGTSLGDNSPCPPSSTQLVLARRISSLAFTCDSAAKQVRVSITAQMESGATRTFESSATLPLGVD